MRKAIITLLLAATCVAPAFADEREYYSALEAFNTTNASSGMSCQYMRQFANENPLLTAAEGENTHYSMLAYYSLNCFKDVEMETNFAHLPAEIPNMLFKSSCPHITKAPLNPKEIHESCLAALIPRH
jgi:hypothetical protein